LVVKPRHEWTVSAGLREQGFTDFLPTYSERHIWSDRSKLVEMPLFPGYVFGAFALRDKLQVLRTPGVRSIVSFSKMPCPVDDAELEAIRVAIRSGLPVEPWPVTGVGQKVRVESGPLYGLEGTLLQDKGAYRVVIAVSLLNRSVAVEIDRGSLGVLLPRAQPAREPLPKAS
jgi:transcription antitermination factor NusG